MSKKINNISTSVYLWLSIATLLILFSFIAPYIFTHCHSGINFSDKGEIGDTIGGIMNPFIAIAGVIATFLAFFMQVRANKLQTEQFIKSFNKSIVDSKVASYYKMQLLSIDIDNILNDISERSKNIDEYISEIKSNPYIGTPLYRSTLSIYNRLNNYDRDSTFKGFKLFISTNPDWLDLFNSLYNKFEYLPESFEMIYKIADNHNADIYKEKIKIRDMLIVLEKKCIVGRNAAYKENDTSLQLCIEEYLLKYRSEIKLHNEGGFQAIKNYLTDLKKQLFTEDPEDFDSLREIISSITLLMNIIEQKSNQLPPQFDKFMKELISKDKNVKSELEFIKKAINKELQKTNIEDIQKEYDIISRN